ncbi:MAG: tetratricopeptide repeat protein [Chloroflexi bacterium]|uniref:tetratricopeptide repeat protein n=1 Tax=Candidatus Flexifilum breve TaxID=3140694 RepID=UPI0031346D88|nr:tetratricopeptide repeat protein [Chloroflexota bacterium]MBK9748415.1 tetratricopeptide repeat protein [Chloroflexota bacterium]
MDETDFCTPPEGTSFHDRAYLAQCLTVLENHLGDHVWLVTHIEQVHRVLHAALETDPLVHRSINLFTRLVPDFLLSDNFTAPLERAFQALLRAMELKDPNLLAQIAGVMASLNPLKGDIHRAYHNVKTAIGYARDATEVEAVLRAHVRIIEALAYRSFGNMPPTLIENTLHLLNFTSDVRLKTEAHLALANMYNHQEQLKLAQEHGDTAFNYADQLHDNTYKMRALLMLAVTNRLLKDTAAAEDFIQSALDLKDGVESERRLGIMLCELGGLRYAQEQYVEAEQLYLRAHAMFTNLQQQNHIAYAEHGLGLVWTMLKRYDKARTALERVLDEYRWNHNTYGVAEINYLLGRCEMLAGNARAGVAFFRTAHGLAYQLDPSPARDFLMKWIQDWLRRVQDGEFGSV